MVTPVLSTLRLPAKQPVSRKSLLAGETVSGGFPTDRSSASPENLAGSIMADGGLGFLQSRLQEKMEGLFGESAAAAATGFDTGLSVSPEATADRIVGFALSLRGVFDRQNEGLSPEELRSAFEMEIRRGISEGFGHARGVLSDLELMEGEVQGNVDATWDLVQQKLEEIFNPQDPAAEND